MAFSQTQGNVSSSVGNLHGPLVSGQANTKPVTLLPADIARRRVKVILLF